MGCGSYSADDWSKLRKSRSLDKSSTNEIFKARSINPKYDPKFIQMREAHDSEEHPESTPIAIGVDVTGSMGYLSTQIIKESLNELMQELYSKGFVKDPQLLFAAIGDVDDVAPLQVTQFESDIRIAEQLMDLWIENRGGDLPEDYELLWYFLAKHTDIDSFKLRGQKGFCFTIGDAPCHDTLTNISIQKIFDDKVTRPFTSKQLYELVSRKYETFHIIITRSGELFDYIMPGRVIEIAKDEVRYLPQIIMTAIQLTQGKNKEEVLSQWGYVARKVVEKAIVNLVIPQQDSIDF